MEPEHVLIGGRWNFSCDGSYAGARAKYLMRLFVQSKKTKQPDIRKRLGHELAKILFVLRMNARLREVDLARAAKVSKKYVRNVHQGTQVPSFSYLIRTFALFSIDLLPEVVGDVT